MVAHSNILRLDSRHILTRRVENGAITTEIAQQFKRFDAFSTIRFLFAAKLILVKALVSPEVIIIPAEFALSNLYLTFLMKHAIKPRQV